MTRPSKTASRSAQAASTPCDLCNDYGWVIGGDGVARPCTCGLTARRHNSTLFRNADIPVRFREKDFTSFKAARGDKDRAQILEAARSYANTFSQAESEGLILRGAPGSGKTHIAVAILKTVIERGFRGYYANFNDLLSRLRDSYNTNSSEVEGELLREIDAADLLVLDDVGAESTTDWVRDRLYLIVNRRYENARATIITTNCDEAELEVRIGPRTASRLYEMCAGDFPPFPRQDYRKASMR